MTKQEIFDRVATHLLTQGRRSDADDGEGKRECLYRGPNGLKCAVGCLIADEHYTVAVEGLGVSWAFGLDPDLEHVLVKSGIPNEKDSLDLLATLQRVHDGMLPGAWREGLVVTAERFGLSAAVLG